MNKYVQSFIFILICSLSQAQSSKWFSYYNQDSTLMGFKNEEGKALTEAKFVMIGCNSFEYAVAVVEQITEDDFSTYYLRYDGSKFAEDSVYFFDAAADAETNYFLRFRSPKTQKVGLMDVDGRIVFPAVYDDMKTVQNDFVWALKGAKREFAKDNFGNPDNEHYSWVGGQSQLLFIEGDVLCKNFMRDEKGEFLNCNLDYSTHEWSNKPSTDSLRVSFKAKGKGYISFENLDKSFDFWFTNSFLKNPSEQQLEQLSADSLVLWGEDEGWTGLAKQDIFGQGNESLNDFLQSIQNNNYVWFSQYEDFYLYDFSMFDAYFDDCFDFNGSEFPCYSVVITNKSTDQQSHLTFIRNDNTWKLVSLSLR